MSLYEPINVLKPVAEGLWIVDGPLVHMSFAVVSMPFPTRMVVVRLADGGLWVWSPTELGRALRESVEALGPVRHLVSPNRLHYAHIADWKRAFPDAVAWASPGVRERALSQHIDVVFDRDLGSVAESIWEKDIHQLVFSGSPVMREVVFFHRASRTIVLADLIENFEKDKIDGALSALARLGGVVDPDGKTPLDYRLSFLGHHAEARAGYERMLGWSPERVVLAHGRWYESHGTDELRRAFRWI